MKRGREVPISREDLDKVLAAMTGDYILVGGQALAFWIGYFGVHYRLDVVTRDADILARDFEDVRKIAAGVGGKPILRNKAAVSALLGCVRIDHGDNEYATLDVIDRVLGMSREQVINRAVEIELPPPHSHPFHVMHPIDVTESRVVNFCELKEKQDGNGEAQLVMALDVAKRFIETPTRPLRSTPSRSSCAWRRSTSAKSTGWRRASFSGHHSMRSIRATSSCRAASASSSAGRPRSWRCSMTCRGEP